MSRTHMTLLGACWAVALTLTAVHAWASSCYEPVSTAELVLEFVTVDGEARAPMSEYNGEFTLTSGYGHVILSVDGYQESLDKVSVEGELRSARS